MIALTPLVITLSSGSYVVHLSHAKLDGMPQTAVVLSLDEEARAVRFLRSSDASRFRAAHRFLRNVLAVHTGHHPTLLRFCVNAYGKPFLDPPSLAFNLSHSADMALVAVTKAPFVGVDIEAERDLPDHMDIARSTFSDAEVQALEQGDASDRLSAFFRCWTRKEAVVKALGCGLSIPLNNFTVPIGEEADTTIVVQGLGKVHLRSVKVLHGFHAAIAVYDGKATA